MEIEFTLREEFIKLGQLLKATGLVSSGVEAKIVINNGEVIVNDEVEIRRGRKIVAGDLVVYDNQIIRII